MQSPTRRAADPNQLAKLDLEDQPSTDRWIEAQPPTERWVEDQPSTERYIQEEPTDEVDSDLVGLYYEMLRHGVELRRAHDRACERRDPHVIRAVAKTLVDHEESVRSLRVFITARSRARDGLCHAWQSVGSVDAA